MKKLLFIAMVIAGCGHHIHEGKITDKRHEPETYYNYTIMIPCGKALCPIVQTAFDDEDYILTVTGKDESGNHYTEDFYVSEKTFNCLNQGDYFNDSIPCETEDDGNL